MAAAKGPVTLDMDDVGKRMKGAVAALKHEFGGLRTGRASASLLEPVNVEAYGNTVPISQVGTINVPEPRMISVQVWDRALVSAVDKAIRSAGLGLNPQVDGTLVRIPIPQLTEERRKELSKIAHKYAESGKVAVRNVRRDAMDLLKKLEKDKHLGEDERKGLEEKVQKLTDQHIKEIDDALAAKDKEIMQV
jgi:ribosome recycling factor